MLQCGRLRNPQFNKNNEMTPFLERLGMLESKIVSNLHQE